MKAMALQPIKSGGDCFDDVVATLSNWYEQDYAMIYADAMLFEFLDEAPDRKTIASRMALLYQPLQMLETFHGYRGKIHRTAAPALGWQIVQNEVEAGFPVVMIVDAYHLPWDDKYQKEHYFTHMVIAVGVEANAHLHCIDPYFEKTDLLLPREELELGFEAALTLRPGPTRIDGREQLAAVFRPLLQRQLDELVPAFGALVEALPGIDFAEETKGCADFGGSRLYHQLSSLIYARHNFAKSLDYIADTYSLEPFRHYAEQCRQLSGKWTTVRALLAKMNFASQLANAPDLTPHLQQRIRQIVEAEAALLEQLIITLDGGASDPDTAIKEQIVGEAQAAVAGSSRHVTSTIPVDLAGYCNNRAIGAVRNNDYHDADFDAFGYYYARQNVPEHSLRVADMSFVFPDLPNGEPDNISCEGQVIALPTDEVWGIMLLGSGEQGDHTETGKLVYEDGTSTELLIDFPDWWNRSAHSGHVIAWHTNLEHAVKGRTSDRVQLFAKKLTFDEPKRVRELVLPTLPNLHLFGLTLWK